MTKQEVIPNEDATIEDALNYFRNHCVLCKCSNLCVNCDIGVALRCIEKQIPKPIVDNEEIRGFYCPTCGRLVVAYNNGKLDHCHRCGQKLKWGNVE